MDKRLDQLSALIDKVADKLHKSHEPACDFGTGIPLYKTEIHTIDAIGKNPDLTITELAESMNVTKGAVSQMVNKLVAKGLIIKKRSKKDARFFTLHLTENGQIGFDKHEEYHSMIYNIVRNYFGNSYDESIDKYFYVFNSLDEILDLVENTSTDLMD